MWKLIAFVLPLSADTFAVSTLIGASQIAVYRQRRIALLFAAFEAGVPLVGLALGRPVAQKIGGGADYVAGAALIVISVWMKFSGDDEEHTAERMASGRGLALLGLAFAISLDELAIGFGIGLARQPVAAIIVAIAVQAFVVAQLGLPLGARVSERFRERVENFAALALYALGVYLIIAQVVKK